MYYGKVEICGVNTAELKTLGEDEKEALLLKMKTGTPAEQRNAREALIYGNLRLVLSIVQRFAHRGESIDDLFQVGCIGLIKAIDRFDPTLGVKLSTYAVPMIAGELRRFLRDNNTIRVSRSMRDLAYRALQAREALSGALGRDPTIEEITAKIQENADAENKDDSKEEIESERESEIITCEEVSAALEAIAQPVSLFDPVYSDSGSGDAVYLMDQIKDQSENDEAWLEGIVLRESLSKLSERERSIIELRFFSGRTQMEIASEIGISQAQVSRLEKGALAKIKKNFS